MRCLVLRTAFACHLARRGPTPHLPACCVRRLRARAAAAALFRLLLPLLVVPLPLVLPLLPLSNSACSPQQQLFLFCFQREDRLWQARGFHQRKRLPTHAKKLVGTSPPASALSLSALAPTRACARCMSVRHFTFSIFIFQAKRAQHAQHAHTHTLARWLSAFPCASRPLRPLYRCVLPRARVRGPPLPVFLVLRAFPLPLSCCAAWPTLRAPPPLLLLLLAAAPPPALCARAPTPATACAANPARFFW